MAKLTPINVTEQQKEEFYRIYRILTSDFLELDTYVERKRGFLEDAHRDEHMFEAVLNYFKKVESDIDSPKLTPEITDFMNVMSKQLDFANDFIANSQKELVELEERFERSRAFIDSFKAGITVLNDAGECELSDAVILLVEYLNSLGNILEPEERENLIQQQAQQ